MLWTDSTGTTHDLSTAKRINVGEVAIRLNCSTRTVLRWISDGELKPVIKHSERFIQVYEVAVNDYIARKTIFPPTQNKKPVGEKTGQH